MIIFFHGADAWRAKEKVHELTDAYLAKNSGGTGLFQFDFDDSADERALFQQIEETIRGGGLFASKKFVVVRNIFKKEQKESQEKSGKAAKGKKSPVNASDRAGIFQALLERHEDIIEKDSPVILLVWETQSLKKTHALVKYLEKKSGLKQEFTLLDEQHLEAWSVAYLKKYAPEVNITREALKQLLIETGTDLFRLESELLKLANFVGQGTIQSDMVDQLVSRGDHLENRVFDAFNALAIGDTKTALSILERYATSIDETLKILGLCAWQLRMIASISDAYYTQGARTESLIARATGFKPFQIGKILRNIGRYTPDDMVRRFKLLTDLDGQAKGQNGGLDPHLALSLFVMKF